MAERNPHRLEARWFFTGSMDVENEELEVAEEENEAGERENKEEDERGVKRL